MKKVQKAAAVVSFLVAGLSQASNAVTHSCSCVPSKVYAGYIGAGNSAKYKVDCTNGNGYALGNSSDQLAQSRYSAALAAFMAQKELIIQFYSSDGSLNCGVASADNTAFPHGFYVK